MRTEILHTIEIDYPKCPDTVPEELVRLVEFQRASEELQKIPLEFQRASEELQKIQLAGLAAKDRTAPLGEFSLQGERQLLSLVDRKLKFKGDEIPGQWRITAVEMAASRVPTAESTIGDTTIRHFVYSGQDVADTSPPGDLRKPDMSEAGGPNTAFRIILTDGLRLLSNYPRIVKGELVPPQLYVEGISGTIAVVQGQSDFAKETESINIGLVEEEPSGKLVRHEIAFDRGSDGAFVNLYAETNAPQEGWVVSPDESRESRIARVAPIMVKQSIDTNGDFAKSAA